MFGLVASLLDRLVTVLGWIGAFLIGLIPAIYCYEVAARYFFSAPTTWSYELGGYLLCLGTLLCAPVVTREHGHVAIVFVAETLPMASRRRLKSAIGLAAAAVCLAVAATTADEVSSQIARNVQTTAAFAIPKWWLTAALPYALAASGLYFIRDAILTRAAPSA